MGANKPAPQRGVGASRGLQLNLSPPVSIGPDNQEWPLLFEMVERPTEGDYFKMSTVHEILAPVRNILVAHGHTHWHPATLFKGTAEGLQLSVPQRINCLLSLFTEKCASHCSVASLPFHRKTLPSQRPWLGCLTNDKIWDASCHLSARHL